jgi:hypothetical protein
VVRSVKRWIDRHDKYHPDPSAYDSQGSDSESEAEDPERTVTRQGAKKPVPQISVIKNTTKASGKKTVSGKKVTQRGPDKRRLVRRVDNRVYRNKWPPLEKDAKQIHDVISKKDKQGETNRSYGATTVLCCVVVRSGVYRKLCFTNVEGPMAPAMRKKAEALGYHCVQAMQAHAEGEAIQYINTYKDMRLISMGCDKPHCKECRIAMTHYFGPNYPTESSTSAKVYKQWKNPEALQDALNQPTGARPSTW